MSSRKRTVRKLPPLKRGAPPWDGRAIRCALCRCPGVAGDRRGGDWRCVQADAVLHYVCPSHFPADGATTSAFAAAYELVLAALQLRIGPDTDVATQEVEE